MEHDDVTYIAEQIREAEKLSEEERMLLVNLKVNLRGPVLPQHQIESRAGSHLPTNEEMEKFQSLVRIKKGCYDPKEDKIITRNWKAFCKLHNWDPEKPKPFLQLREGNKTYVRSKLQRKKFVQFLVDGLPNRTLYSVYHRFRILYEDRAYRRFTSSEDRMILDHLEHCTRLNERRRYSDLAKVLKRSRGSIWRRYRILKRKRLAKEDST